MTLGSGGISLAVAFALLLGAACSSTSTNESSSGGSGGAGGSGTGGTPASDCCTVRVNEPGCTDKAVQACVCNFDSSCCTSSWTSLCVGTAELNCNACGSTGGSGGMGGGEPGGGAAGASQVCVGTTGGMCPSVGPNPGSDCCFPGKGQCSDQNLFDCATSVNQDCLVSWTECCVNVLQAEGLCDSATPIDAGT